MHKKIFLGILLLSCKSFPPKEVGEEFFLKKKIKENLFCYSSFSSSEECLFKLEVFSFSSWEEALGEYLKYYNKHFPRDYFPIPLPKKGGAFFTKKDPKRAFLYQGSFFLLFSSSSPFSKERWREILSSFSQEIHQEKAIPFYIFYLPRAYLLKDRGFFFFCSLVKKLCLRRFLTTQEAKDFLLSLSYKKPISFWEKGEYWEESPKKGYIRYKEYIFLYSKDSKEDLKEVFSRISSFIKELPDDRPF